MKCNKQTGFTGIEFVAIVAAIAIGTIILLGVASGFFTGPKKNAAILEISKITNAAKLYRLANNNYTGITMSALSGSGYDIEPFTTGTGQNTYGLDVTIAGSNTNTDATIVYETDEATACNALIERFQNADGVKATPTCASTTDFTVVLE